MKKLKMKKLIPFLLCFVMILSATASAAYADERTSDTDVALFLEDLEDFSYEEVPEYEGVPYVEVNENAPFFTEEELTTTASEVYSELDDLGRCGTAYAVIGQEIMPTESRGQIGQVRPTGWHTVKYEETIISDRYLYNRCHLVAYELSAENANTENLITGTRYMNVTGMLPFENEVADYVEDTDHHVLYRVTPVFEEEELVARGVLMEAQSVEDDEISFCVFCYNVQPGITIDYETGESELDADAEAEVAAAEEALTSFEAQRAEEAEAEESREEVSEAETVTNEEPVAEEPVGQDYILNTNTKKFHYPNCRSVDQMKEKNKRAYTGTRGEVIAMGYDPCKNCNP